MMPFLDAELNRLFPDWFEQQKERVETQKEAEAHPKSAGADGHPSQQAH